MMYADKPNSILVESYRGDTVECRFSGSIVVSDINGEILDSYGNPDLTTPLRSVAKPFQAYSILKNIRDTKLASEDIAIISSSHNGEAEHIHAVRRLLKKNNLSEDLLKCGTHPPFFFSITQSSLLSNKAILPVQHNCSGKHAGMLLLSNQLGGNLNNYCSVEDPVQKVIASDLVDAFGLSGHQRTPLLDGCGVPTYGVRLRQIAQGYARFAEAVEVPNINPVLSHIGHSMIENPFLIAGSNRLETDLMRLVPVIAKIGAQGVYCLAIPKEKIGVCIKIDSGNADASETAALAILVKLKLVSDDMISQLDRYINRPVYTSQNAIAGKFRSLI